MLDETRKPEKRAQAVCPWWLGYIIDNPLRRLIHNPTRILSPYVRPGMTVADIGCGMGLFTIAAAKLVGPAGRVIAADLQQKMLDVMMRRAGRAGVADRITVHKTEPDRIGITEPVDLVLTFYMAHEVPSVKTFLAEIASILKPGGAYLLVEPKGHVSAEAYDRTVASARAAGFEPVEQPVIRGSRATLFRKR